jgi:hypothetical protein
MLDVPPYTCEKWNRRFEKVECTSRPLLFWSKLWFYVQFQCQIDTPAVQNLTNHSEQQNHNRRARGWPWRWPQRPQPTTNRESDDANWYNRIAKISLARFISVDLLSSVHFGNLIEMAPQWPRWQWWWWCRAQYPTDLANTWQIAS